MTRKLKFWNYMLFVSRKPDGSSYERTMQLYASVCAYSQKDAIQLLAEKGHTISLYEFRMMWSNCWGTSMDNVEPQRGLWIEFEKDKPEKV